MEIKRLLTNICSQDLESSVMFYTSLFDLEKSYESDWFVHLVSKGTQLELGIISHNIDIVPEPTRGNISGVYLTFVVKDVDQFYINCCDLGYQVLQTPTLTTYGQKRMLYQFD